MKINNDYYMTFKKNHEIWTNLSGQWIKETNNKIISELIELKYILTHKCFTESDKESKINHIINNYSNWSNLSEEEIKSSKELEDKADIICTKLINFFSEFNFEPNFRFVNTLQKHCYSEIEATNYVSNYFNLVDHQYKYEVIEKMKSLEFKDLITDLNSMNTTTSINNRFKVYYGSQGTGKTTKALQETNNVVMVCHSAMLPNDLLEDFKFEQGKPTFKKSALWLAMENGTKITLDEINLLPFESLRFLQSILDNKQEINYKDHTIKIKDGFQIIGTMNLVVNGSVFNLPEPLVDRALELKEYKLTSKQLLGALL